MDNLLTAQQVANRLGCHINTVWKYIHSGKLKAHKLGGVRHWRIRESDLEEFAYGLGEQPK